MRKTAVAVNVVQALAPTLQFIIFSALALVTAMAWLDGLSWPTYQLAQFRFQWLLAAFVLAAIYAFARRPVWFASYCFIALVNFVPLGDVFLPRAAEANSNANRPLKLLQLNLRSGNSQYKSVAALIRREQPDIVVLEELTETWRKKLEPILPFSVTAPRSDTYGIGLYSRFPFTNSRILYLGPTGHPSIDCTLQTEHPVRIFHTHLQGPVKRKYHRWQVSELRDMETYLRGQTDNLLFCGDMNTMSSVAPFWRTMRNLNLRDSRRGFGLQLSWPVNLYIPPIPVLTIDHIFVGKQVRVIERNMGPNVGSDHLPIVLKFAN